VAATSGAPTGTRGIGAESTTGWEPVTAAASKRAVITSRAHERDERTVSYVVDPTIARLVRQGYLGHGEPVEDAYSLAEDYERRFRMQAYAQENTDQAISMTINLPHVMTAEHEVRAFGDTLMKYLPRLRGITVYPNGAIAGQQITPVPLEEALAANAITVAETEDKCVGGVCGI
jgi:ribonucleoside-diphosphate reductase alpha chain